MLVHALITSIRASPEPAILLVLDRLDKVLADLVCSGTGVAVLAEYNAAQLLLVPVLHSIGLLLLFLRLLGITRVRVQILLGRLALDVQVMAELALATLVATALLVKNTQHSLRVHAEGHLLHLHGLEQISRLSLRILGGLLLGLALLLLGFFPLGVGRFAGRGLCLQLLDLLLGGTTFFLLHRVSKSLALRGRVSLGEERSGILTYIFHAKSLG